MTLAESPVNAAPIRKEIYLAPRVSWEAVVKKLGRPEVWCKNQFKTYASFPEFAWLKGKVWADKALFSEYRGVILEQAESGRNMAEHSQIPYPIQIFYDPESDKSTNFLGQEVPSNPNKAGMGLDILAESLAETVGKKGKVDKQSLTYLWGCWNDTAQKVIGQLVSRGVLLPQPMSEYKVNPELVDQIERRNAREEKETERLINKLAVTLSSRGI